MDDAVLPGDYQRNTDVVRRADSPVMVKQVCTELGDVYRAGPCAAAALPYHPTREIRSRRPAIPARKPATATSTRWQLGIPEGAKPAPQALVLAQPDPTGSVSE
ncbi:hypothetical protein [Streptomyces cellostaticus]|nr:hypothetical protein [Streptomyces cellostaticus]GHI10095.1 hypothetical protein Scel_84160 [Streptomyces cellostaticus]